MLSRGGGEIVDETCLIEPVDALLGGIIQRNLSEKPLNR